MRLLLDHILRRSRQNVTRLTSAPRQYFYISFPQPEEGGLLQSPEPEELALRPAGAPSEDARSPSLRKLSALEEDSPDVVPVSVLAEVPPPSEEKQDVAHARENMFADVRWTEFPSLDDQLDDFMSQYLHRRAQGIPLPDDVDLTEKDRKTGCLAMDDLVQDLLSLTLRDRPSPPGRSPSDLYEAGDLQSEGFNLPCLFPALKEEEPEVLVDIPLPQSPPPSVDALDEGFPVDLSETEILCVKRRGFPSPRDEIPPKVCKLMLQEDPHATRPSAIMLDTRSDGRKYPNMKNIGFPSLDEPIQTERPGLQTVNLNETLLRGPSCDQEVPLKLRQLKPREDPLGPSPAPAEKMYPDMRNIRFPSLD